MNLANMNILLADDDEDDRNFFSKALIELSIPCTLSTVKDGQDLMQLLKNETLPLPDVLFLDINMPRKSGIECLEEIKKDSRLKQLAVVMFSTANDPTKISMLFKKGVNVYIHKPNDFTQLKQVIYHALPILLEKMFPKSNVKYLLNA